MSRPVETFPDYRMGRYCCLPSALAILLNKKYSTCAKWFSDDAINGRNGKSVSYRTIRRILHKFVGVKRVMEYWFDPARDPKLSLFAKGHPTGTYFLILYRDEDRNNNHTHVVVFHDGQVYDNFTEMKKAGLWWDEFDHMNAHVFMMYELKMDKKIALRMAAGVYS